MDNLKVVTSSVLKTIIKDSFLEYDECLSNIVTFLTYRSKSV